MSALTHAGLDLEIDGKSYTLRPLTFEDLEWLELRLRARAIEVGRLSIPSSATEAERTQMMAPILEQAQGINVFENMDKLITPTGFVWVLYRMLSKGHPELTMDTIKFWILDPSISGQLAASMPLLLGFKKSPQTRVVPSKRTTPARPRRGKKS